MPGASFSLHTGFFYSGESICRVKKTMMGALVCKKHSRHGLHNSSKMKHIENQVRDDEKQGASPIDACFIRISILTHG